MILSKSKIYTEKNKFKYEVNVDSDSGSQSIWYEVDKKYGELISNQSDAALVVLLIPAMNGGEDIFLKGVVSERLLYHLRGPVQSVLKIAMPWLQKIQIYPDQLTTVETRAEGVATGFSAGIDSYAALHDYYYSDPLEGFKITHLLYNNVGSHGKGGEDLFHKRFKAIQSVTNRIGLPIIQVNSNIDQFYDGKLTFVQTHTMRNVTVPLLLQFGISRFMYASAFDFRNIYINKTEAIAKTDPVILPMLSTDSLDIMSVGSEYKRVEKVLRVKEIPDSYESLDVCVNGKDAENCSTCWKCMRTLLTLEIADYIDRYYKVFDLDRYHVKRSNFIQQVLRSKHPLMEEIVNFGNASGFNFSLKDRVSSKIKFVLRR